MKNNLLGLVIAGVLTAAIAFVLGAVVGDALNADPGYTLPEAGTLYPLTPNASTSEEMEPTAMLAAAAVPAPEPMLPGATPVYPMVFEREGTATLNGDEPASTGTPDATPESTTVPPPLQETTTTTPATGTQSTTTTAAVTTTPPATGVTQPPAGATTTTQAAAGTQPTTVMTTVTTATTPPATGVTQPPAGAPAGGMTATIVRFFDLCADASSPACPSGIGATILMSGTAAPPPPLRFEVTPEVTRNLIPGLRCDPGWPSNTKIPIVITSNRPFSLLHVTLLSADGVELDAVSNTRSPPSEHAWYDQRVKQSQPTGTAVSNGAHTCLTLETDKLRPTGSVNRAGPFTIVVQGYAGNSSLAKTITFSGQYAAEKPPVRILPLDANRAYVIVPQLPGESSVVWVYDEFESRAYQPTGPIGCEGPPPNLDTRSTRRSPLAAPQAFSQEDMNAPDYPWNRSYTHYTLWDLDLSVGTTYTMCVKWVNEGVTKEWNLKTPGGIELTVRSGDLRHTRTRTAGTLLVHIYGVPGCFVADPQPYQARTVPFPEFTLHGSGTYTGTYQAQMCRSNGRHLGSDIRLEALFPDGSNQVYGVATVPVKTLVDKCTTPGADLKKAPCTSTLEWSDPNILCGGGLTEPSCPESLWFSLDVTMSITDNRPGAQAKPQDWVISKIARLGTPGETVPLP